MLLVISYNTSFIPVEDIYGIFALSFLNDPNIRLLPEDVQLANFEANEIKGRVLRTFDPLLRGQIKKYLTRSDRYDPNQLDYLKTYPNANYEALGDMFNRSTFRSERHRRNQPDEVNNTNWGEIANRIHSLEQTSNFKAICSILCDPNGLLNLIHNTGTSVLDKLVNGYALLDALNECHYDPNGKSIISKSNYDIQQLVSKYI